MKCLCMLLALSVVVACSEEGSEGALDVTGEVDVTPESDTSASCSEPCTFAHGTGSCVDGTCQLTVCDDGFLNCDKDPSNGCETDSHNDSENCAGCNRPCGLGNTCDAGTCTTCPPDFDDCDRDGSNGCEVDLNSPRFCGQCTLCPPGTECTFSGCEATGETVCDVMEQTGCEEEHKCVILAAAGGAYCWSEEATTVELNEPCDLGAHEDCPAGSMCINAGDGFTCRAFCDWNMEGSCSDGFNCSGYLSSSDTLSLGVCLPDCDLLDPESCGEGRGCRFYMAGEEANIPVTFCGAADDKEVFSECSGSNACKAGSQCITGLCASYCALDGTGPPCSGTCIAYDEIPLPNIGLCR